MFKRFMALLGDEGGQSGDGDGTAALHLAAAALLVEAAVLDGHFDEAEHRTISALLETRFGLDNAAATSLIDEARDAVAGSTQLYAFTRVVKDRFGPDERVRMMEMLWEVAYADGHLHEFEASLARQVAGLIHVPDRDSGAARKRVLARLGLPVTAPS